MSKQHKNTSRYGVGVYKVKSPSAVQVNPFRAEICFNGERLHLGVFPHASHARAARQGAIRLLKSCAFL